MTNRVLLSQGPDRAGEGALGQHLGVRPSTGEQMTWHLEPSTFGLYGGIAPSTLAGFAEQQWPPCPVCGTTIDVDAICVPTTPHDPEVLYMMGQWHCPRGCDPKRRSPGELPEISEPFRYGTAANRGLCECCGAQRPTAPPWSDEWFCSSCAHHVLPPNAASVKTRTYFAQTGKPCPCHVGSVTDLTELLDQTKIDNILQKVWIATEDYAALLAEAGTTPRPTITDRVAAARAISNYANSLVATRTAKLEAELA